LPKIYFVNWFRKDATGKYLWPGYGENSRVLKWICERVEGKAEAQKTAIGNLPSAQALDLNGLNIPSDSLKALESVDTTGWKKEAEDIETYYGRFDGVLPQALKEQLTALRQRLA
jgi:phosphoenolpyruvate carboxykinase (GTP)